VARLASGFIQLVDAFLNDKELYQGLRMTKDIYLPKNILPDDNNTVIKATPRPTQEREYEVEKCNGLEIDENGALLGLFDWKGYGEMAHGIIANSNKVVVNAFINYVKRITRRNNAEVNQQITSIEERREKEVLVKTANQNEFQVQDMCSSCINRFFNEFNK
jgi:hypothetical protein